MCRNDEGGTMTRAEMIARLESVRERIANSRPKVEYMQDSVRIDAEQRSAWLMLADLDAVLAALREPDEREEDGRLIDGGLSTCEGLFDYFGLTNGCTRGGEAGDHPIGCLCWDCSLPGNRPAGEEEKRDLRGTVDRAAGSDGDHVAAVGSAPMTDAELDALKALAEKATPGEWFVEAYEGSQRIWTHDPEGEGDYQIADCRCSPEDAELFAAARDAVPRLVEALREARRERDVARAGSSNWQRRSDYWRHRAERAEAAEAEAQRLSAEKESSE